METGVIYTKDSRGHVIATDDRYSKILSDLEYVLVDIKKLIEEWNKELDEKSNEYDVVEKDLEKAEKVAEDLSRAYVDSEEADDELEKAAREADEKVDILAERESEVYFEKCALEDLIEQAEDLLDDLENKN